MTPIKYRFAQKKGSRGPPRTDPLWSDKDLGFSLISCDNVRFYFPLELLRYDSRFFLRNTNPNTTEYRFNEAFATANTLRILCYKYAYRYQLNSKRLRLPGVYRLQPHHAYMYDKSPEHCIDLARYQRLNYEYGCLYDDKKLLMKPEANPSHTLKTNLAEGFVIACQNGWHMDAGSDVAEAFSAYHDPDNYQDSRYAWAQLLGDGRLIYENVGPEMMQMLSPSYQRGLYEAGKARNAKEAKMIFMDIVDPDRTEEPNKWTHGVMKDEDEDMEFAHLIDEDQQMEDSNESSESSESDKLDY